MLYYRTLELNQIEDFWKLLNTLDAETDYIAVSLQHSTVSSSLLIPFSFAQQFSISKKDVPIPLPL